MAVTEILGTDSLSSSRVTLNNNFLDLQDEIVDLKALLNPQTNTLSGVDITATSITISGSPGTSVLGDATATTLEVDAETNLKGAIRKTGTSTSAANLTTTLPVTLADSTYFVDCANQLTLQPGQEGQEITLICGGAGAVQANLVGGATSINMDAVGSTLTIRYFDTTWYIIGSHACTIS